MESLALHMGAPTVNCEDSASFIYIVEAKLVTPIVKHIDINACFLQEYFDNGIFVPKYEKSSAMITDMCNKSCSGPIIIRSNKWMNGLRLYATSDIEHYQLMILHEFIVY